MSRDRYLARAPEPSFDICAPERENTRLVTQIGHEASRGCRISSQHSTGKPISIGDARSAATCRSSRSDTTPPLYPIEPTPEKLEGLT